MARYHRTNKGCNAIITPIFFQNFAKKCNDVTLNDKLRDGNVSRHKSPRVVTTDQREQATTQGISGNYHRSNEWCNAIITPIFFQIFAKKCNNDNYQCILLTPSSLTIVFRH